MFITSSPSFIRIIISLLSKIHFTGFSPGIFITALEIKLYIKLKKNKFKFIISQSYSKYNK